MWFPASELSKVLECMTGLWVDDRGARQKSYAVSVRRRGSEDPHIICSIQYTDGLWDGGRTLKLERRVQSSLSKDVRIVWGAHETSFVATVERKRILWTPTSSGRPYVWTKAEKGEERRCGGTPPGKAQKSEAFFTTTTKKPETAAAAPRSNEETYGKESFFREETAKSAENFGKILPSPPSYADALVAKSGQRSRAAMKRMPSQPPPPPPPVLPPVLPADIIFAKRAAEGNWEPAYLLSEGDTALAAGTVRVCWLDSAESVLPASDTVPAL